MSRKELRRIAKDALFWALRKDGGRPEFYKKDPHWSLAAAQWVQILIDLGPEEDVCPPR